MGEHVGYPISVDVNGESDNDFCFFMKTRSALVSTDNNCFCPGGYKTFFMLNLAEHEICPANKSHITNIC